MVDHKIQKMSFDEYGANYKVKMKISMDLGWIDRVVFSVDLGNETKSFQLNFVESDEYYSYFETTVYLNTRAVYYYYFSYFANNIFHYYKRINKTENQSVTLEECWKLSVNFEVPDWAQGGIMYHIFVDRFKRGSENPPEPMKNRIIHEDWDDNKVSVEANPDGIWNNDFYGGDLKGIEKELPYIKSLGTDILYLSPIVRSQSNHRYDTANYMEIDPYVGTDEDLKSLCDACHRRGIKVVLDAVFNHTGNDSIYFNEFGNYDSLGAFQSPESEYYEFYQKYWIDGKLHFSYWWGKENLPVCDDKSKKWQDYIFGENGVISHWFDLGIDGLRLDVADELTDEFIEGIRREAKAKKEDAFILGEVWKNPMRMNRGYILSGKGMDSVMNYQIVDAIIRYYKYSDTKKLEDKINEIMIEYPRDTIYSLMNFTSTHDISRLIEIFGCHAAFNEMGEWAWDLNDQSPAWIKKHNITQHQYKTGKKIMKSYLYALMFMPGNFSIFYGDEVGSRGIGNLKNRVPFPWKKRDKDLLYFYKKLLQIRKNNKFLRKARLRIVEITDEHFIFERYDAKEGILIAVNRSHHESHLSLPMEYLDAEVLAKRKKCSKEKLSPYGAIILKRK